MDKREFTGIFRRKLDNSWRIVIPKKWRAGDAAEEFLLFDDRNLEKQKITCFLPTITTSFFDKLGQQDPKLDLVQKRILMASATIVEMDKYGRLALPRGFIQAAGISEDVVLVGLLDRFEIWVPEKYYQSRMANSAITSAI